VVSSARVGEVMVMVFRPRLSQKDWLVIPVCDGFGDFSPKWTGKNGTFFAIVKS
jgi:hypothetical protein